jgi:hypothetical protein
MRSEEIKAEPRPSAESSRMACGMRLMRLSRLVLID